MAGSKSHFARPDVFLRRHFFTRQQGDVPCADDVAAAVGIGADGVDDTGDLIDYPAVGAFPCTPLSAVNGAQLAVFGGPLVPDGDLVLVQVLDVGASLQKPEQFMDDGTDVQALGCQKRQAVFQVVSHHAAEYGTRAGSGPVALVNATVQYFLQKVQILSFHVFCVLFLHVGSNCHDLDCSAIGYQGVLRYFLLLAYRRCVIL